MKILMATFRDKWENDILRYFKFIIETLTKKYNYTLVDLSDYKIGSDIRDVYKTYHAANQILVIENHNEILITDIFPNFFDKSTDDIKKFVLADDVHKYIDIKNKSGYYDKFDCILCTYKKPYQKLYPKISTSKVAWCPHAYTQDYVLPFNSEPKNKILLSGAMGTVYPIRKYIYQLYEDKQSNFSEKISYLRHPGYKNFGEPHHRAKIGKSYAKILNEHICCFSDCSTYGYIVSKYFEIPATGSLLLAQKPEDDNLESLGFIEDVNYISCTKDNIKEKIDWILDPSNRNRVDEIRKNGMQMVRDNHSIKKRAVFIHKYLSKKVKINQN